MNQAAYTTWSLFAGALMVFAIVVCFLGTAGEIPRLRAQTVAAKNKFSFRQLLRELLQAFQNPSFRVIFFGMILSTFVIAVEGVFNPFMGFHFWEMTTEQLSLIPIGQLTGLALAVLVIPALTKRFDKKVTLVGSGFIIIININLPIILALSGASWFPEPGSSALLVLLIVNHGVTLFLALILFATLNSIFADIADEHELEVGERREGVIFSARTFALKGSSSLGLIFGGILLDYIAFPRGASLGSVPDDIVWQLGFIAGPATSIFTFFGLVLFLGYRIDRQRHEEIRAAIAAAKVDNR